MQRSRGRSVLAVVVGLALSACSPTPSRAPQATTLVAAQTDAPPPPSPSPGSTDAAPLPSETPGEAPASGIVAGSVNRTSLAISATYDVNAAITVATGALETATLIEVRNDSGDGIDRLELNTIAARLGSIRITDATVDDVPVKVRVRDQTLVVPLGGILPAGASARVRIEFRARLTTGLTGSDWMFTSAGGTLSLHRWIPWISREIPFDRPNHGNPFVTPTSPKVDVEIVTDERMDLAAPAAAILDVPLGAGRAWAFTLENVRDVSVVLAPSFNVIRREVGGVPVRVFTRAGSVNRDRLMGLAVDALRSEVDLLGVAYPWPVLSIVETQGGEGLESPGLIWIPRTESTLNRTYLVYHEIAHQWFYGLVGSDQQREPFADEGAADLIARTALGIIRNSRCPLEALDRAITRYSTNCYYEVIQVQGGLVLEEIRSRIGSNRFWRAMGAYLEDNRYGLGGTRRLLDALSDAAGDVNLLPLLRARFPSLY
jgi:hypothetical protein